MHVLVNRGWIPQALIAASCRRWQPPRFHQDEGIAVVPTRKILELSPDVLRGKVWENLVIERYERVPIQISPLS